MIYQKQNNMKQHQIQTMLNLHRKAVAVLSDILSTKADIKAIQDSLALNQYDPTLTTRMRNYWEDSYNERLAALRNLLAMQSEQYAILAQQLCEPFVPKESYLVTTHEIVTV